MADGDAMALLFDRLKVILELIRAYMPPVTRVSTYCLPRNLRRKSVDELVELRKLELGLLYVGAESGDDVVLKGVLGRDKLRLLAQIDEALKGAGCVPFLPVCSRCLVFELLLA
ncbi:MAG: hypothetical protein OIF57_19675 [Marinobacterium sp.]|nr:hypothetical protein [Marinobacterium sp.]